MSDKLSYRDYLIWTAAHTAHALTDGIRTALDMNDEQYAISVLEHTLDVGKQLLDVRNPNPERVEPKPE